jgi:hypothetical protein
MVHGPWFRAFSPEISLAGSGIWIHGSRAQGLGFMVHGLGLNREESRPSGRLGGIPPFNGLQGYLAHQKEPPPPRTTIGP